MRIIVDTMGADKGVAEVIKGSMNYMKKHEVSLIFVGPQEEIDRELADYEYNSHRVDIINATEFIDNKEEPALAIRRKKHSSIVLGLRALKDGQGDAFLSAGSTGALLAGGLFIIKRIKGIERAALASVFPTLEGQSFLLDIGANVDCKPEYLEQFAHMGSIYSSEVLGVSDPRVGLINIGSEKGKGDSLRKESYHILEESSLNFIGNYEVRDIMTGKCDVMVCDGFTGNIILKTTEGLAISLGEDLKGSLKSSRRGKLAGLLLKPNLKEVKNKLDYREYGGAPLLGIRKPVIKAHGSSDALAIENALKQTVTFIEKDIIGIIDKNIDN